MSSVFVAVGTVKGKKRRVGLRVGGGNLDIDGVKKHFTKHPFPVKFDSMPEIFEVPTNEDGVAMMPLHKAVRNPKELTAMVNKANEAIRSETGGNPQPAEDLDLKPGTVIEGENSRTVPAGTSEIVGESPIKSDEKVSVRAKAAKKEE